jgi:16S rRNA processing protein RimM
VTQPQPPGAPRRGRPLRRSRAAPGAQLSLEPLFPPRDEPREGFTAVGRVARPHGLRGELRVAAFSPEAPNLRAGRHLWLGGNEVTLTASRRATDSWIVVVAGISSRSAAERFAGHLFEAPDGEVARESDDSYFVHELIGLRVITDTGEELGEVVEVLQPGANDVYVVRGPRGEVLLPAVAEVVSRIDLPVGVMTITPLPGLLDGSA